MVKLVFGNETKVVKFDDLDVGDGFILGNVTYIKIEPEFSDGDDWWDYETDEYIIGNFQFNAIELPSMELCSFDDDDVVTPVSIEVKVD